MPRLRTHVYQSHVFGERWIYCLCARCSAFGHLPSMWWQGVLRDLSKGSSGEGSADSSGVVRPASHSARTCKWSPGTECHRAWAQAKLLTLGGCQTELSFHNPQLKPGHLALESGLHSGFCLSVLADLVQVGSDAFSYIKMCKQALKLRPRCDLVGCEQRYGCICVS